MGKRSNGEGTIYKRSDGLWAGQCMITLNDSSIKRKTIYGKTQKKVKIENILKDLDINPVIITNGDNVNNLKVLLS